jgi:hypothetical protein
MDGHKRFSQHRDAVSKSHPGQAASKARKIANKKKYARGGVFTGVVGMAVMQEAGVSHQLRVSPVRSDRYYY